METTQNLNEQPYIKLSVSTKGVYTWDIKIIGLDVEALKSKNEEMIKAFGSQNSGGLIIKGKGKDDGED